MRCYVIEYDALCEATGSGSGGGGLPVPGGAGIDANLPGGTASSSSVNLLYLLSGLVATALLVSL